MVGPKARFFSVCCLVDIRDLFVCVIFFSAEITCQIFNGITEEMTEEARGILHRVRVRTCTLNSESLVFDIVRKDGIQWHENMTAFARRNEHAHPKMKQE